MAHPDAVLEKGLAMVRSHDDQGIVVLALFSQMLEQPSELAIDPRDSRVVQTTKLGNRRFDREILQQIVMGSQKTGHFLARNGVERRIDVS